MTSNTHEDFVQKIEKLLRKAENAGTKEEADAFFAGAQKLMVKFAISEQEIAELRGVLVDEIVEDTFDFTGIYKDALFFIGSSVGRVNDLKVMISRSQAWGKSRPARTTIHLIGFSKDVARVKALIASLTTQVLTEQVRWWKTEGKAEFEADYYAAKHDAYKARRTFIDGFRTEVDRRLRDAKKAGVDEVVKEKSTAKDITSQAASDSVALVLKSRKDQVDAWYDERYGRITRKSRVGGYQSGGGGARNAGRAAGGRADIGLGKLGGNRGQLGR